MLQTKSVSPQLLSVLADLMNLNELSAFRLVGGTALALQLGHYFSNDINLLTDNDFDRNKVIAVISKIHTLQEISFVDLGITCFIKEVKINIFYSSVPFVGTIILHSGIRMSPPEDIAAFKLNAITDCKEQKDFYDLYFILEIIYFSDMIEMYQKKYPSYNVKAVFTGLSQIEEANNSVIPDLNVPLTWIEVKEKLIKECTDYLREIKSKKNELENSRLKDLRELVKQNISF